MKFINYLNEIFDSNIKIFKLSPTKSEILNKVISKNKVLYDFYLNNKQFHFLAYEISDMEKSFTDFNLEDKKIFTIMFLPVENNHELYFDSLEGKITSNDFIGSLFSAIKKCLENIIKDFKPDGFLFATNNEGLISIYDRIVRIYPQKYGYKNFKKFDHHMMGMGFKAWLVTKINPENTKIKIKKK